LTLAGVVGAFAQEYSMAVTDIEGLEKLQREFGPFKAKLEELTGFKFKFYAVSSRTAAVEAMKSKKVDFVMTGPAEYVIFKTLVNPQIVVGLNRPDYYTVISVMADSGIDSIAALKGKKIALGDVGSTSKHLAPLQLLKDYGLDPIKDVERVHTSIKLGWEGLKRGDVAAFATTSDKFLSMRNGEKDLEPGAIKVIGRGGDLPCDVMIASPYLPESVIAKVRDAIVKNSKALTDEITKGDDNKKYLGMKFVGSISDASYNYVRQMYLSAGYPQFSKFIE
jgi:phosphonate transport system substrate-binding protein